MSEFNFYNINKDLISINWYIMAVITNHNINTYHMSLKLDLMYNLIYLFKKTNKFFLRVTL